MGDAVTMIRIEYFDKGPKFAKGILHEYALSVKIDGENITVDEKGDPIFAVMIFRPFYTLLKYFEQESNWEKRGLALGDSITRLVFWNVSEDKMKIAFEYGKDAGEVPDINEFSESEIKNVDKVEFRNEVFRVIGAYIEEMGWRDDEYVKKYYRGEELDIQGFVELYDWVRAIKN